MEKLLKALLARTDLLIKLQVLVGLRDMNQSQKIQALYGVSVAQKEIANILGIPINTVTGVVAKAAKKMKSNKLSMEKEK